MKLFMIFLLIVVIITVKLYNDCEDRGGQLMKNMYGVYVCAKAIEAEE